MSLSWFRQALPVSVFLSTCLSCLILNHRSAASPAGLCVWAGAEVPTPASSSGRGRHHGCGTSSGSRWSALTRLPSLPRVPSTALAPPCAASLAGLRRPECAHHTGCPHLSGRGHRLSNQPPPLSPELSLPWALHFSLFLKECDFEHWSGSDEPRDSRRRARKLQGPRK